MVQSADGSDGSGPNNLITADPRRRRRELVDDDDDDGDVSRKLAATGKRTTGATAGVSSE